MNQNKEEYRKLARSFEAKFHSKQEAGLLANLNKKNVKAFQITKETILEDIKKELSFYQNEKGDRLEKQEVEYVLELVRKELWGYGVLDDLIHEKEISDIKLYGADHVRVKQTGCRWDADVSFEDDREYLMFVTKLLERNKVNLGTANAIQTFTDASQEDFILRITVISALLVDGGKPVVAIRKIPKKKYTLKMLEQAGMFEEKKEKLKLILVQKKDYFSDEKKDFDHFMHQMIHSKGILFTGKGASGKTTLMNAMIAEIPQTESVMICQENAELFDKHHPDLFSCHVLTNQGDSKVRYELGDLTRAALLVDLDRVIVGEVKEGAEAAGLSKASMTGHKCWTSVHGESCEMALDKMADYISQATGYSNRESLKQLLGFEYVIHLKNFRVDEIVKITGWDKEKEELVLKKVYPFASNQEVIPFKKEE